MPSPTSRELAEKTLTVARGFVGIGRDNSRAQITKFLNLFGLPFADANGKPYPYCAAGASYSLCKAYALLTQKVFTPANSVEVFQGLLKPINKNYLLLSPSCGVMISEARARKQWVSGVKGIQPGCFVFFDWQKDGRADHVEICLEPLASADDLNIRTVGFNTSSENLSDGGAVAEKTRAVSHIFGYIRM